MADKELHLSEAERLKMKKRFLSRRWLINCWAMLMVTFIVVAGIIFDNDKYMVVATTLVAIPIAFTSLETLNKSKMHDSAERKE